MHGLWQDLRHSLRLFARTPGFTLTAVLVLALGIGANTAVFTVTNALLLKPLGGRTAGELAGVFLREKGPDGGYRHFSAAEYRDLRRAGGPFASLLAQEVVPVGVSEGAATRKGFACVVSSDYFQTLGVTPPVGRAFLPPEEDPSAPPSVVVSHAYWKKHGATAAALGRAVTINRRSFTIVGVAPEGFTGTLALLSPEFWVPLGASAFVKETPGAAGALVHHPAHRSLMVVGRLKPGISLEAAAASMPPLAASLRQGAGGEETEIELVLGGLSRLSFSAGPRTDAESALVMVFLMGMAAVVLLIACLNLANMLLARGGARGREIAIRLALGGGRLRVVRQLLTESLLLSVAGAALGLLLAFAGTTLLARTVVAVIPFVVAFDAAPDVRVLLATAALSVMSTLAFGLGPALRMARADVLPQVKDQAGQLPARAGSLPLRNLLVVGQLAMCLALLTAAGLFVRGAFEARSADPGFPLERGLVVESDVSLAGYDEARGADAYRRVLARLRGVPGVESASMASSIPLGLVSSVRGVRRIDGTADPSAHASAVAVASDYFRTVRLPLLRGRDFTAAEERQETPTRPVIVDEPLARRLWPDGEALGQQIQVEGPGDHGAGWTAPLEVVGVAAGVRDSLFDHDPNPHLYVPAAADYHAGMFLHVRLASDDPRAAAALADRVRQEVRAADAGVPVLSLKTLAEHRDTSLYLWIARAAADVFAAFGLSALLLAVLGVYGVKAYLVSRRTREIGIRMALGATRLDVLGLVLRDGLWLTLAGLAAGLGLSLALSQVLASWVYGVTGIEPAVLIAAGAILGGATLLACYLPARRAMALAPSVALRSE
ncbi:MAG TPA: ABC transporter permease [Vicinamibacterales bacterium]|nr:ABC transporter permease [Vicinamibacterales bacterium]